MTAEIIEAMARAKMRSHGYKDGQIVSHKEKNSETWRLICQDMRAALSAARPLIEAAAREACAEEARRWFIGMFTGWKGHTGDSLITLDDAEDHANDCGQDCADAIRSLSPLNKDGRDG